MNVIQSAINSIRQKAGEILGSQYIVNLKDWSNPQNRQQFNQQVIQPQIQDYNEKVNYSKQNPFFNSQNTPVDWVGKVAQEFKTRGVYEGLHGISNPILMSPYIRPIAEPVVSKVRSANYKSGMKNKFINDLLGMDKQKMDQIYRPDANIKGKYYGPEIY